MAAHGPRRAILHIAQVRVSSLHSVEVVWCVAPMEDSHGDPSQEDFIDPNTLSRGSSRPTTRYPAGLGDSSQVILATRHSPHAPFTLPLSPSSPSSPQSVVSPILSKSTPLMVESGSTSLPLYPPCAECIAEGTTNLLIMVLPAAAGLALADGLALHVDTALMIRFAMRHCCKWPMPTGPKTPMKNMPCS